MAFFDAPRAPSQDPFRTPEWLAPPDNVLPAIAALNVLVLDAPGLVVVGAFASVFPCGWELTLRVQVADPASLGGPGLVVPGRSHDALRFGALLPDGTKLTNDDGAPPPLARPQGPVMRWIGGGGSAGLTADRLWFWPLPPRGRITLACAWPDRGIDEQTAGFEAQLLLDAAPRARTLWADERPLPGSDEEFVL